MTVEELNKAKESATSVAYLKFTLLLAQYPNDLYCFFEGKDSRYYHLRIKHVYKKNYHYLTCGGKANVIQLYNKMKSKRFNTKYKLSYYVDKDFDKSIKNKYKIIYETPCYSIENLYCLESVLIEILKCEFMLAEESPEFKNCISVYQKRLKEFLYAILPFNIWYYTVKKKAEQTGSKTNVSLDDFLPKNIVKVSLKKVDINYNYTSIYSIFPTAIRVTNAEIEDSALYFLGKDYISTLRGKYIFNNFFLEFIRLLIEDANSASKRTILTSKVKFNFDGGLALSQLSQYAFSPPCLVEFIDKFNG